VEELLDGEWICDVSDKAIMEVSWKFLT
jgi:hypothetical protein